MGFGGLDLSSNRSGVRIDRVVEATNIEIIDGFSGKEGGSTRQNASAIGTGAAITAGFDYFPNPSTQRGIVTTSDGRIFKDEGTQTWSVSLKTGLTADQATTITEGGLEASGRDKKLFFANGADAVQVLAADGSSTTDIATPAADWATQQPVKMLVHQQRMWAIASHFAYGSVIGDHEDFTGSGSQLFQIYPGEADELINMASIFGRLYFFKRPFGLYYLDQSIDLVNPATWALVKVSDRIGCAGPKALVQTQNEAVFVSPQGGIHFLSGAERFGDVQDSDITALLSLETLFRNDADLSRLDRAECAYYEDKKQVWIAYTSRTGTRNDRILKLDVSDPTNIKAFVTEKDECESIWIYREAGTRRRRPLLGSHDGFVSETDEQNRNVDGAAYTAVLQTPFTDFGWLDSSLTSRDKLLDFVEIIAEPVGDHDIAVDVFIDGDFSETLLFNMGTAGSALDSFVLDTDRLDGAGVVNVMRRATGCGQRFSFRVSNSGLNQSFNIDQIVAYFRVGGEIGRLT